MALSQKNLKALEKELQEGTAGGEALRRCFLEVFSVRGECERIHRERGVAKPTLSHFIHGTKHPNFWTTTQILEELGYRIRLEEIPTKGQK